MSCMAASSKDFLDRSLADLEDTEILGSRNFDESNSLGARLSAEFVHQMIQDVASPDGTIERLRGDRVWQALRAQDVTSLVDMDLPTLKQRAMVERGWLFKASIFDDTRSLLSASMQHWRDRARYLEGL